jgi:hypothetical protein
MSPTIGRTDGHERRADAIRHAGPPFTTTLDITKEPTMDVFSISSTAGAAAGNAAFLVVQRLLTHLEVPGKITRAEVNALVADALTQVPTVNNPIKNDTRALLESLKR